MRAMNPDELARLTRVERQVAYILRHLEIDPELAAGFPAAGSTFGSPADIFTSPAPPGVGAAAGLPGPPDPLTASPYPPALLNAIQRGKMIDAIKIYRETTGASLRDAKAAVEAIARGGLP
jgi:hypothetical protein